jgi:hypothetical protein
MGKAFLQTKSPTIMFENGGQKSPQKRKTVILYQKSRKLVLARLFFNFNALNSVLFHC